MDTAKGTPMDTDTASTAKERDAMGTLNENPLGLRGIEFVELASPDPAALRALLRDFGFARTMRHERASVDVYEQGEIRFLLASEPRSVSAAFAKAHGPSITSMGWRVAGDAFAAQDVGVRRGATAREGDYRVQGRPMPALAGIGDSLLYLVQETHGGPSERLAAMGFVPHEAPDAPGDKGFLAIDHLTNNVEKGTMERWSNFYKEVFGFTEVRYFDIRGARTGLTSYALRSPCGTFCIPINEATDAKSQIQEYLDEYKGPGIQHLAFTTNNICRSLAALEGTSLSFLDIEPDYYAKVFDRVPNVKEDHAEIQRRNVLVDGDDDGYLLQIFTRNVVGPIFIELIQRENHTSFGEGNFGALFRSIERDQARRGVFGDDAKA